MSDKVKITYPEMPANLVGNLNSLITALSSSSSDLNTYGGNVKGFMHQTGGAVQNVANISSGKTTRTLVDTWYYTTVDGNNAHTSMTTVSGHLNTPVSTLEQNLPAVRDGMSAIQTLQASNGEVPKDQADGIRKQINDLTGALNNIGIALDAAAKLINSHNNGMPLACATGFQIGGTYPTFADNAFDNSKVNMSGNGSGSGDGAQAIRNAISDPEEANALIELAQEQGASLSDIAALLKKGATPEQVVNWLAEGKNLEGAANLLGRGATTEQVSQWIDQGMSPKYAQQLLDKGISPQGIDNIADNLSGSVPARWNQVPQKNLAAALQRWANGTRVFANDGTPFRNLQKGGKYPIPGNVPRDIPEGSPSPFTEYTVANANNPNLPGAARIVVDNRTGNVYFFFDHYNPNSGIKVPYSYINKVLGG